MSKFVGGLPSILKSDVTKRAEIDVVSSTMADSTLTGLTSIPYNGGAPMMEFCDAKEDCNISFEITTGSSFDISQRTANISTIFNTDDGGGVRVRSRQTTTTNTSFLVEVGNGVNDRNTLFSVNQASMLTDVPANFLDEVTCSDLLTVNSYTVAQANALAPSAGAIAFISDDATPQLAYYNGASWRRVIDGLPIAT